MKESIEAVTRRIEEAIKAEMRTHTKEEFWVTHYGANDIHPKHLVYWIVVRTDEEKQRLDRDKVLIGKLRKLLDKHDYPVEGRAGVHIGFESKQTVVREADGNFYNYWKWTAELKQGSALAIIRHDK